MIYIDKVTDMKPLGDLTKTKFKESTATFMKYFSNISTPSIIP